MFVITISFYKTPGEKKLIAENKLLVSQYNQINNKLSQIENIFQVIKFQDDSIYRAIFGVEPVPYSIRQAGIGGGNLYASLEGYNSSNIMINTSKQVDQLFALIEVQNKSFHELIDYTRSNKKKMTCIPAIQPIDNKELIRISSGFGMRINPILGIRLMHPGMDFAAQYGTNVYATGSGIVKDVVLSKRGYGNHIIIDHGYYYETLYAHLWRTYVNKGDSVKRGEVIGTVGSTGFSTGPHLHYEVHYKGIPVDPVDYYFNDLTPEEYQKIVALSLRDNRSMD
ncbi:MAG: M23 family metallopeptidase [Marinilabiliales bacterium]